MPTIKELNQRHDSVDVAKLEELQAIYDGGDAFDAKLATFLPQREAETAKRYSLRKKEAVYRNYVGPIIDYFASLLFSSRPVAEAKRKGGTEPQADPGEYYSKFREDCNLTGADVDAVMKTMLTDAMVGRCSWLVVNQPWDGKPLPDNMVDHEKRKLGDCWLEKLDATQVLDWETGDDGFEMVIVKKRSAKRTSVAGSRDQITETWRVFSRTTIEVYEISYKRTSPPPVDTAVPLKTTIPHGFGRVPVVPLDLPVGLWVANRLKAPQLGHFRLSSAHTWGLSTTCYAMPVFTLKQDDKGNFRAPKMGAGYGVYIGTGDTVTWLAPPSDHYVALASEISSHKDEIYRIAQQMALGVENNAAAVGRSGDSKAEDAKSTKVVLLAFSRIVKETLEVIYDLISHVRGDKYEWSIGGLDDFAAADIEGLVDVLDKVELAGGIPSKTFKVAIKQRLAESLLPDMDQAMKQTIRKEIEDGVAQTEVDDQQALEFGRMHMKAASMALQDDHEPPTKPTGNRTGGGGKPAKAPVGRGRSKAPATASAG